MLTVPGLSAHGEGIPLPLALSVRLPGSGSVVTELTLHRPGWGGVAVDKSPAEGRVCMLGEST